MENERYYTLKLEGLERKLPICRVSENLSFAGLIMLDVEMTVRSATALLAKCADFDYIITAESKGIALAFEMARQCERNYVVARKSVKLYMKNPISVQVKSISTDNVQTLYLDERDADAIKGKRVLIVDDIISTGESLDALMKLTEAAGGEIVGCAAVLAEGVASKRDDIIFLEELPLFYD